MLRPILLVEDNPNDIELTMIALERSRIANPVVSVRDGVEALEFLRREGQYATRLNENPAVILLDKKLPKMDGHEVLKAVRLDEKLKRIPVVMLTSSREEKDLLRSYDLGVNAYVVKPVEFDDFMAAINDLGMFWAVLNEPPPPAI
ncbi:response regulator [Trinickia diaoshuihuensis]|uniref:response regulator n=1 Tax=Trinickia diaoshuihuensis TaxID=2292265 RepID=UPI000E2434CA|nr:response regulator [Trinickia diaoshuihuensis]